MRTSDKLLIFFFSLIFISTLIQIVAICIKDNEDDPIPFKKGMTIYPGQSVTIEFKVDMNDMEFCADIHDDSICLFETDSIGKLYHYHIIKSYLKNNN